MMKIAVRAFIATVVLAVLTGLVYPAVMTGIAQVALKSKANGSLVEVDGKTVGSSLIGQEWKGDQWFYGRPSAVDYDASTSSGTNLGPTSKDLNSAIEDRAAAIIKLEGPYNPGLPSRRSRRPADVVVQRVGPRHQRGGGDAPGPADRGRRRDHRGCRPSTRPGPRPGSRSRVPRRASRERARAQPRVGALGVAVIDVAVRDRIVVVLGRGRMDVDPALHVARAAGRGMPLIMLALGYPVSRHQQAFITRAIDEAFGARVHLDARIVARLDELARTSVRRTTSRSWRPGAMSDASDRSSPAYPPRLARSYPSRRCVVPVPPVNARDEPGDSSGWVST